jgi:hypothetical protein
MPSPDEHETEEQKMAKERDVDKLVSIFDLKIQKALNLKESVSARVMLSYDKGKNSREFKVLSRQIPELMKHRIELWLETHMDLNDFVSRSTLDYVDADDLPHVINY